MTETPILTRPAPYAPYLEPRTEGPPGLSPLDMAAFTVVHGDFAAQLAHRAALLAARRGDVLDCLPEGAAAAEELLDLLLETLAARPDYSVGDRVTRPDGVEMAIDRDDPLGTVTHLAAEDFCLMQKDPGGEEYRLVGATLCFPSHWTLAEKLGHPLTVIHEPVPQYDATLGRRVNRVFDVLHPDRPLVRINWGVTHKSALYLPRSHDARPMAEIGPETPLYLRTERQTLVRLPRSGAVVFGIKTSVTPIDELPAHEAVGLEAALGRLDPAVIAYKGGARLVARAREVLGAMAGAA